MKHSIKKAMLTGAFRLLPSGFCFCRSCDRLTGYEAVLAGRSGRCRKQRTAAQLVHDVWRPFDSSHFQF